MTRREILDEFDLNCLRAVTRKDEFYLGKAAAYREIIGTKEATKQYYAALKKLTADDRQ